MFAFRFDAAIVAAVKTIRGLYRNPEHPPPSFNPETATEKEFPNASFPPHTAFAGMEPVDKDATSVTKSRNFFMGLLSRYFLSATV